jgi:hypothetical protein
LLSFYDVIRYAILGLPKSLARIKALSKRLFYKRIWFIGKKVSCEARSLSPKVIAIKEVVKGRITSSLEGI